VAENEGAVVTTREFPITKDVERQRARKHLESVPREQISEHADRVRPGETFANVVTALFFALGWVIGASWRGFVFCCLAVRYGYRAGAHVPVTAAKPEQARSHRPGPGGTLIEE
jgi:hypothetical protein